MARRGFGVAGGLPPEIVRGVAVEAEALGYATLWANDTPTGDGLATLAEAARVTSRIRLGVGVIPLDRRPPEGILRRAEDVEIPLDRLILGVGSGAARGAEAVELVRAGCAALAGATAAKVVVGALGPRMTALAGRAADGVLLNWLTPAQAAASAGAIRAVAADAGRPTPIVGAYVRTALGAAAGPILRDQAERYEAVPAYAAHFRRMGVRAIETCVIGDDAAAIEAGLAPFAAALDEAVVRAIVADERAEAYLDLLRAAAPDDAR